MYICRDMKSYLLNKVEVQVQVIGSAPLSISTYPEDSKPF